MLLLTLLLAILNSLLLLLLLWNASVIGEALKDLSATDMMIAAAATEEREIVIEIEIAMIVVTETEIETEIVIAVMEIGKEVEDEMLVDQKEELDAPRTLYALLCCLNRFAACPFSLLDSVVVVVCTACRSFGSSSLFLNSNFLFCMSG